MGARFVSVCAEDHCDLVPFLHAYYRVHKVPFKPDPVVLLHIDAHPDLSLPSQAPRASVAQWRQPDSLYDILDSEGGIAEFLLPLFATNCLQEMVWVRPPWATQLPDGSVSFHIFEQQGRPYVNYECAYYLDNQDFAAPASDEMVAEVHLTTCTVEDSLPETRSKKPTWILDICLDYFLTNNPFLSDLLERLDNELQTNQAMSAKEAATAVLDAYRQLPYRQQEARVWNSRKRGCEQSMAENLSALGKVVRCFPEVSDEEMRQFVALFTDASISQRLLQVLPSLSLSTREYIAEHNVLLLLPHETGLDRAAIEQSMKALERFIIEWMERMGCLPMFVCVCRSSDPMGDASPPPQPVRVDNGYTPRQEVDWIAARTVNLLESLFHDKQRVLMQWDMTQDVFETVQAFVEYERQRLRLK